MLFQSVRYPAQVFHQILKKPLFLDIRFIILSAYIMQRSRKNKRRNDTVAAGAPPYSGDWAGPSENKCFCTEQADRDGHPL